MKKMDAPGFSIIEIIIVLFVILAILGIGYRYFESTKGSTVSVVSTTKKNANSRIYFQEKGYLYSVNVDTKKVSQITEVQDDSYGTLGVGNVGVLNSPDFSKAAYVKDGFLNIFDGTKSTKLSQPEAMSGKKISVLINSWSSDSKYLIYNLMYPYSMPTQSIDNSIDGMYVYSVDTNTSKKIPIENCQGWLGNSLKVVYLKEVDGISNAYNIRSHDIASGDDTLLSAENLRNTSNIVLSSDGTKILYQTYKYNTQTGSNDVEIIIANADNTNKKTTLSGKWGDYQNLLFQRSSNSNVVYNKQNTEDCSGRIVDNSDGSCYVNYVMKSGSDKKLLEIERLIGNYDDNSIVVLSRSVPEDSYRPSLTLINLETGESDKLYTGAEARSINLNI